MTTKEIFSVTRIVNEDGCFDLQFRKDTRHERTNAPTYYRWKAQFIVTMPKEHIKLLEKIKKELSCGQVTISKNQARFAVQKIQDISECVLPYFRKNPLQQNKRKDFELWAKAVEIIERNKGKAMTLWKKNDLHSLMQIHESCQKYKTRTRTSKWLDQAKMFSSASPA